MEDLKVMEEELEGTVTFVDLSHGIFLDVGAVKDGLAPWDGIVRGHGEAYAWSLNPKVGERVRGLWVTCVFLEKQRFYLSYPGPGPSRGAAGKGGNNDFAAAM